MNLFILKKEKDLVSAIIENKIIESRRMPIPRCDYRKLNVEESCLFRVKNHLKVRFYRNDKFNSDNAIRQALQKQFDKYCAN